MLKTFQALEEENAFRKEHFPFIRTFEDMLLVRAIGLHQATGDPVSLKVLYTKGFASVATVQRRLMRLKRMGVVEQTGSEDDKRVVMLTLSKQVFRDYRKLGRIMRKFWGEGA